MLNNVSYDHHMCIEMAYLSLSCCVLDAIYIINTGNSSVCVCDCVCVS